MSKKNINNPSRKKTITAFIASRYQTKPITKIRETRIYLDNFHSGSWFTNYDDAKEYVKSKCKRQIAKFNRILREIELEK